MKKTLRLLMTAGTLLFGAAMLCAGDTPDKAEGKGGPEKWAEGRLDRMKEKLELTDSQVAKLKELGKGNKEGLKALRDKVKADQANLAVLVDKKASDAELNAALKGLADDKAKMAEASRKQRDSFKEILTPLQQAKMAVAASERRMDGGRWKEGMKCKGDKKKCDGKKKDEAKEDGGDKETAKDKE